MITKYFRLLYKNVLLFSKMNFIIKLFFYIYTFIVINKLINGYIFPMKLLVFIIFNQD